MSLLLDHIIKQGEKSLAPYGYRLGDIMGSGGMGVVYALQPEGPFANDLVMKMIHPTLHKMCEAERQLEHEAKIEIALQDLPNIVQTLHYQKHSQGHGYKVMRKMQGCSLKAWLHASSLKTPEVNSKRTPIFPLKARARRKDFKARLGAIIPIIQQLEAVVATIHATGVIHGDLKPSNIYIAQDLKQLTVFDFGLARHIHDQQQPFKISYKAYTPLYASPKVLNGNLPGKEDDLYSIAAMCWEMLFGRASLQARVLPVRIENFRELQATLQPILKLN